ncbi:PhoH family protein [Parvibium lacunae]|uniref:PhoH-like protein n=2 Tax=Parvibium lacunae TaxID=1888893 RepID=A0A368L5B1_9BURK|nr:PhoH family protein [Parvibium lacunae]
MASLCGPLDENLKQIANALDVSLARRGSRVICSGASEKAEKAQRVLSYFARRAEALHPNSLEVDDIQLGLVEIQQMADLSADGLAAERIRPVRVTLDGVYGEAPTPQITAAAASSAPLLRTRRTDLKGRTPNQCTYLEQILAHDITFGIGPAGTGKTYLAVACAVDALERDSVKRIVLTRPAVEAGERLGFLPGDLAQKVDPYLRPLYDALYDLLGFDRVQRLFEKQTIEIAPLAYMRGRTLNHAFVILDEAQNTTPEQMKMFLTRIGFGSKAVVTGDISQIDLPRHMKSGLIEAQAILAQVRGIAFTQFTSQDVVRHPLVARIVEAYAAHGQKSDKASPNA